jgi:hypothetical protein
MSEFQFKATTLEDSETSRRITRRHLVSRRRSSSHLDSLKEGGSAPTLNQSMATSSISDFSAPSVAHVTIGPRVEVTKVDFEIKPSLITMVQASTFCGKPHEDANAHLQHFLEVCSTIAIRGVIADAIRLRLFPFSLLGKAKQWFYA